MEKRTGDFMRNVGVIVVSVTAIAFVFQLATAGSLTPVASPASTFYALSDIFNAIASESFDSSPFTADKEGSVVNVARCIAEQMSGGTCP